MKTNYFVSRLLRPLFALTVACTIATATTTFAFAEGDTTEVTNTTETDPVITEAVDINGSQDTQDTEIKLVDNGNDYPAALAVHGSGGKLGSLNANVTAIQTVDGIFGIDVYSGGTITTIAEGVTISASAINGTAYAVDLWNGTIGTLAGDVYATTTGAGTAYGVNNAYYSKINAITGNITATAEGNGNAYGINNGPDDNWVYYAASIGDISGDIEVTASGTGSAYGIVSYVGSTIGNVTGDITVNAIDGSYAYGIQMYSGATIGKIDSQINVTVNESENGTNYTQAYGIKLWDTIDSLTLAAGTSITVTGADANYAIYTAGNLTLKSTASLTGSDATAVTINGGITVGNGSTLTLTEGNYVFGDGKLAGYHIAIDDSASITIDGDVTLANSTDLDLYLGDSYDGGTLLTLTEGSSFAELYTLNGVTTTTSVTTINIYLSDDLTNAYELDSSSLDISQLITTSTTAEYDSFTTGGYFPSTYTLYGTNENGTTYSLDTLSASDFVSSLDVGEFDVVTVTSNANGTTVTVDDGTVASTDPFYVLDAAGLSGTGESLGDVTVNFEGGDFIKFGEEGSADYYNRSGVFIGSATEAIEIDRLTVNVTGKINTSLIAGAMAADDAGSDGKGTISDALVVNDGKYITVDGGTINGALVSGSVARVSSTYTTTGGVHTTIKNGAVIGDGVTSNIITTSPGDSNGVYDGSVYGADAMANYSTATVDYTEVVISDATISGFVLGGGSSYGGKSSFTIKGEIGVRSDDPTARVATQVTIGDGATILGGYVIGGNAVINVSTSTNAIVGNTYVDITGGSIDNGTGEGYVYGSTFMISNWTSTTANASHNGDTYVNVTGGTNESLQVYGGGGVVQGDAGFDKTNGGSILTMAGNTNVTINGTAVGDVYGGSNVITYSEEAGYFGGTRTAIIKGNTTINLTDATITGDVYGGGSFDSGEYDASGSSSVVKGDATINISGDTTVAGIISGQGKGGATVEGTSTLNFSEYNNTTDALKVQDFDAINVAEDSSVKLASYTTNGETEFNVAGTVGSDETTSILGSLIVSGDITSTSDADSLIKSGAGSMRVDGSMETYEGSLTVSGGELTLSSDLAASNVTIASGATLSMIISGANTFSNENLTYSNSGELVLTASATLESNTAHRVFKNTSISNAGTVIAYGGSFDSTANTFQINELTNTGLYITTESTTDVSVEITSNSRLSITTEGGDTSIEHVVMDFNIADSMTPAIVTGVIDISANDYNFGDLVGEYSNLLAAYNFEVDLQTGDSVYVSIFVGEGYEDCDIAILHSDNDGVDWEAADVTSVSYSGGYVSFIATDFSPIAVTASVPEPSTVTLGFFALAGLLARRRRKD